MKETHKIFKHNLGKWNRDDIDKNKVPKEIISVFYDSNDDVLFGSTITKGIVSYHYIESKFSIDNHPIFLYSSITYGKGNKECPNPKLIKDFSYIKRYLESFNG